jgi:hypothetical protein
VFHCASPFSKSSATVFFQSLHGHTNTNTNEFRQWNFAPRQPLRDIPQNPLPVHMNLWLKGGSAPTNGQAVEVVISKFTYTPATGSTPTLTPTFTPAPTFTPTPAPLAAPSHLTATTVSDVQINLAWTDDSTNERGFKVKRCQGANCTAFTQIYTTLANIRLWVHFKLGASSELRPESEMHPSSFRLFTFDNAINSDL